MKKSEIFWPCMGSMGSISALAYILFIAVLYFPKGVLQASHAEVYNMGFKSTIQPILIPVLAINYIVLGFKFKTIFPVILGFFTGFPLAVFIVGIVGYIGSFASSFIHIPSIQPFSVSLIIQMILAGALTARGLSDIIKLYKNPKSGKRECLAPSPHITKHAGPHLAIRKTPPPD